ncbi:hypothetical protein [Cellulomonas biazotea]|uniref:Uncharacterized protein n=2 Tax=Cellulomonas biazotea TaxID=1709 RepID=A0A402DNX0_9CELL|nr:hypothetical protein [Cellulomonas biazotea]GCE75808.1 hypothetical protein CBZ_08640 [Cellulomonas biazotea]
MVVDGDRRVRVRGGTVMTPCFTYQLPEVGWALVRGSSGCTTAISFEDVTDVLTTVHVRIQAGTTGGDVDRLVEVTRQSYRDAGMDDWEVDVTQVGGYTVVRANGLDEWGMHDVTYQVPLDGKEFTQDGLAIDAIWVTGPSTKVGDEWARSVIRSLRVR